MKKFKEKLQNFHENVRGKNNGKVTENSKNHIFLAKNRKKTGKKVCFLHPMAIFLWIWLFVVFGFLVAISYAFSIFLHELGHIFVARKRGYYLEKFAISPFGFSVTFKEKNIEILDEFFIAIAGPCANILTAFLCVGIWWLFPSAYFYTADFCTISVLLALFNLLPCFPLDGGRIFVSIASNFVSRQVATKIAKLFNFLFSLLFFALFLASCFINFNPSLLLFSVFLMLGILEISDGLKFEKFNIFTKKTRNFSRMNMIFVQEETTLQDILKVMQSRKSQIFCLTLSSGKTVFLSEKLMQKLAQNFDLSTKLFEIFQK